jgi:RNA polymerase sigma-70 factor (ECF subfamily)
MQNFQFVQEFNTHSNYLRNFAMKLTRDKSAADDLFQETALRAFRHQAQYISNTNLKAWLSTIMKNSFINLYRKQKRRSEIQDTTSEGFYLNLSKDTIGNEGEMNINIQEISRIIDSLDDGYRVPFLMAYQGYQYDEIQEKMNLPMGTIKSRIHHARRILKKQIRVIYDDVAECSF